MKAVFVQTGNAIDYTPSADTAAGDIVVIGSIIGIVQRDISAGVLGSLALTGVYDIVKDSAAVAEGAKVYVTSAKVATATSASNTLIGVALSAAAAADATVRVLLKN